ncbi:MAG: IS256 family transposase [Acidihalobacter sp.]|uniref:IS256 family transposase n=1 Tax=Acidihalobacter sp. TaxID=1872108 RepID=UPI00307CC86B
MGKVVQIDEKRISDPLGERVRGTVEETLNGLLDAEANALCGAQRYERSLERTDYRAGSYARKLHTKAGEVTLKMPKLRKQAFETAIIERYRRRESSIEESMIEMYLAGVSVRRLEDITEALWGTRVSSGTVSKLNQKVYKHIEAWRKRPIEGEYPYVYLDGLVLKRSWAGEVRNVSVLVAFGVGADGYRRILGVAECHKEDKSGWGGFLKHLKERGLGGVISDACLGLTKSLHDDYPEAQWQRCTVHFYRNVFSHVPNAKVKEVARMLKATHAQESLASAQIKAADIVAQLKQMRMSKAADLVDEAIEQTLTYYRFPANHWVRIRTNNPMERIIRQIRRRTRVVGAFPDGQSALMLCAARLRHIAGTKWGTRRYLNMQPLFETTLESTTA